MIKAVLKYFFPLFILLISGYGQLSAHTYRESVLNAAENKSGFPEIASFCIGQQDQAYINNASPSGTAKEETKKIVKAEFEIEEDESIAFKKLLESNPYLTAIFYAIVCGYLFRYLYKCFSFPKHFSHFTSYRWHIYLQVFRI